MAVSGRRCLHSRPQTILIQPRFIVRSLLEPEAKELSPTKRGSYRCAPRGSEHLRLESSGVGITCLPSTRNVHSS